MHDWVVAPCPFRWWQSLHPARRDRQLLLPISKEMVARPGYTELLDHCLSVPSDIDSAMVGTLTILSADYVISGR